VIQNLYIYMLFQHALIANKFLSENKKIYAYIQSNKLRNICVNK
jgi:hypothetical protein